MLGSTSIGDCITRLGWYDTGDRARLGRSFAAAAASRSNASDAFRISVPKILCIALCGVAFTLVGFDDPSCRWPESSSMSSSQALGEHPLALGVFKLL